MCEFDEYGKVLNHDNAEYTCPSCGTVSCWGCNPKDQRGSWHGESRCWQCDTVLVEGKWT